uniref:Uncharacterized protein n=1 Tax=Rhizophora mucronata TaxID=61149 RepID=A0A2P2IN57_RHIMU
MGKMALKSGSGRTESTAQKDAERDSSQVSFSQGKGRRRPCYCCCCCCNRYLVSATCFTRKFPAFFFFFTFLATGQLIIHAQKA